MNYLIRISTIVFCILLFTACGGKSRISDQRHIFQPGHDSIIVYSGILRCENCNQRQVVLRFNSDTSWQADVKYEGLPELQYFKGSYQLKNNVLTLLTDDSADFPKKFTIEGDSLIPVGLEESSLRPIQNNLIEIQWNLKQVKGENISDTLDPYRKPHFILGMISGRITGNGGCNGFSGYYELSGQNKIRISGVISTKMACMDIGFENDFFDVLQNADHYKIQDNFLILMKGDQILAKLTAE